jgi:tetratricopeptide repeat protein
VKRIAGGLFRRGEPADDPDRPQAHQISLLEHNLADWERAFGAEHPDTMNGRDRLAQAYLAAGRNGAAIALLERNHTCRQRIHGPQAPATLAARDSLAVAYRTSGRAGDALRLYEQNLADGA